MISRRVVNASPLIDLRRVGLLEVLNEPGMPVVVPDTVVAEIGAHGATDPAVIAVGAASWIQVVPAPIIPKPVADWSLDAGESAVLALALDGAARISGHPGEVVGRSGSDQGSSYIVRRPR